MSRPRKTKADVRRAALLKCRYAGRYDALGTRSVAPENEALQEQWAATIHVPAAVFLALVGEGLLDGNRGRFRLTEAGRAALAETTR